MFKEKTPSEKINAVAYILHYVDYIIKKYVVGVANIPLYNLIHYYRVCNG